MASGAKSHRPELEKLLVHILPGDTLVNRKFDRSGRALKQLIKLVRDRSGRRVRVRSLDDQLRAAQPFSEALFIVTCDTEVSRQESYLSEAFPEIASSLRDGMQETRSIQQIGS